MPIEEVKQYKVKVRLPSGQEMTFTGSQQDAEFVESHFKAPSARSNVIITDHEIDEAWFKCKKTAAWAFREAVRWTEQKHGVGHAA